MGDHTFEWTAPRARDQSELWSDNVILECALSVYQQNVDPGYQLVGRPDQVDRKNRAVDGIFFSPASGSVAIEITALETFEGQSKTQARVAKHLDAIETELASRLSTGVSCELPAHPFSPGYDWAVVGERLAAYILAEVSSLRPGGARHYIDGVPFAISMAYDPYSPLPFYFTRSDPSANEIRSDLLRHTIKALEHKRAELQSLRQRGYRTALMVTSADRNFYRVTWDLAYKVFLQAERRVGSDHVHDMIFAFTGDLATIYCMAFKGEPALRNNLNSRVMRFGPEYAQVWSEETSG